MNDESLIPKCRNPRVTICFQAIVGKVEQKWTLCKVGLRFFTRRCTHKTGACIFSFESTLFCSHTIHRWYIYIYLHLVVFFEWFSCIEKYTIPMDPPGLGILGWTNRCFAPKKNCQNYNSWGFGRGTSWQIWSRESMIHPLFFLRKKLDLFKQWSLSLWNFITLCFLGGRSFWFWLLTSGNTCDLPALKPT